MDIKKPARVILATSSSLQHRVGAAAVGCSDKIPKCNQTLTDYKAILDRSAERFGCNIEEGYLFLYDALQRARIDLFREGGTPEIIDFLECLIVPGKERFPFGQGLDWQITKDSLGQAVQLIRQNNNDAADLKLRMVIEGIEHTLREMAEDRTS